MIDNSFNLSDKIDKFDFQHAEDFIYAKDVKEFIKRLKEEIRKFDFGEIQESEIIEDIDKLVGDKLK